MKPKSLKDEIHVLNVRIDMLKVAVSMSFIPRRVLTMASDRIDVIGFGLALSLDDETICRILTKAQRTVEESLALHAEDINRIARDLMIEEVASKWQVSKRK